MALVAGVDSSTSGCKVQCHDADSGEVVASGFAPHPPTTPPRSEQDPAAWWTAFMAAADEADLFGANRPAAISIAGQQHGLVALDDAGEVLRPAKLWNDTESAPDAVALTEALSGGAAAWAAASGSALVAATTITKLRWLRRCERPTFDRLGAVLLPHDWLTSQLTGRATTDRGDASGTGWWSPTEERYRTDLLALVDADRDWPTLLPDVLAPTETAGTWGPNGAVVGPGTGDNMAAALSLGLRPGDLAISLGTSGTAFGVSEEAVVDPGGVVSGFADASGRHLPLVCTMNATKVTNAVARLLGVDPAELDRLALAADPGADGLVLVPHLDGERTPNRPGATGSLTGIRSNITREQLARAAVEGVVCNLLDGAEHLAPWLDRGGSDRVLMTGGGARSTAFRQVLADLSGRPVVVPDERELVARGAAIGAAAALSGVNPAVVAERWPLTTSVTTPGSGDHRAIREAYRSRADERGEPCI